MTAFVVVELPMTMLVKLARVAIRDEKNPLVDVALMAVKLVVEAVPAERLDVVALVAVIPVNVASVEIRLEMKEFVEVLFVEINPVIVPEEALRLVTVPVVE